MAKSRKHAPITFTVTSDTPEYIEARRLAAEGALVEVGRQQLPRGIVAATYSTPTAKKNPEGGRMRIRLDPREFVKVLRDYSEWQVKWWREAVQNSVDAGATEIHLDAKPTDDGLGVVVSCRDNGRGMSLDVFENKFLVLGGSGKEESTTTIGGFGEAKKLLILPWLEWHVRSSNFYAHGKLTDGTLLDPVYEPAPVIKGTELRVIMAASYGNHGDATSNECAKEFLQNCNLPHVQFYVGGEPFNERLAPPKKLSTQQYGELWLDRDHDRQSVVVRAGGLFMFTTQYIAPGLGTIVYELTARTVDILTSNRDGFRVRDAEEPLYALTRKLAVEHERALKEAEGFFVKAWKGVTSDERERRYRVERDAEKLAEAGGPTPGRSEPAPMTPEQVRAWLDQLAEMAAREEEQRGYMAMASADVAQFMFDSPVRGQEDVEATAKQLVWTPAFMLMNELQGYKPPADFFPETMSQPVKMLAQLWAELCRWVFIQKNSTAEWGVGFVFSEEAVAMYHRVPEGSTEADANPATVGQWLLLNPFKFVDGSATQELYSKDSREDLRSLYASAIHEATHMADGVRMHDQAFASALTRNFAHCADGFTNVVKIAKKVKVEKTKKPPREKKIRDMGKTTVTCILHDEGGRYRSLRLQDPDDVATIVNQIELRLRRSFSPTEITVLKQRLTFAPTPGDDHYFSIMPPQLELRVETANHIMDRMDQETLNRYTANRPVSVGLTVDDLADLFGLRAGLPPDFVSLRADLWTSQIGFDIIRASTSYSTIGTTSFFARLLDDYPSAFRMLSFDLLTNGFVDNRALEDHPFAKTLLHGLGLDETKSIVEQLDRTGGLSDPGLCDAVGYLVCANSFSAVKIKQYGVEPIMEPADRV